MEKGEGEKDGEKSTVARTIKAPAIEPLHSSPMFFHAVPAFLRRVATEDDDTASILVTATAAVYRLSLSAIRHQHNHSHVRNSASHNGSRYVHLRGISPPNPRRHTLYSAPDKMQLEWSDH